MNSEDYGHCYEFYINGDIKWKKLADEMGYFSGEALRSQFKRERKKRGDKSRQDVVAEGNNDGGQSIREQPSPTMKETIEIKEDGNLVSSRLISIESADLKSPEKLMEAHGFDPSEWVLVNAVNNYWNGMRPKDMGLIELYQSKIVVKPKVQDEITFEDVNRFFEDFDPMAFSVYSEPKQYKRGGLVLEIDLADAHVGSEAMSFDQLQERVINLVQEIKQRCIGLTLEKIYLVQLGDILHFDNYARQTTSGTAIRYGTSFYEMFDNATKLMISVIDELSTITAVEVVNLYGNHDKISSYTLAKTVEAYYRYNAKVQIDAKSDARKFRQIGVSSVAFVHGDMPKSAIASTFQKENRKLFGDTLYSEIHVGHLHHEMSNEKDGVIVRYVPSINATDEWHNANGYTGTKQGTHCFLWDLEKGLHNIWIIPAK